VRKVFGKSIAVLSAPLASQRGVTLIESLVALGLAAIILTAIMAMVVTAVNTSTSSKTRTVATGYANEGSEVAREMRDAVDWQTFFAQYVSPGTVCSICQVTSTSSLAASGVSVTPYTRTVTFSDASPAGNPQSRVYVDVVVTWKDHNKDEKVELTSYLTDWHK